MTREEAKELLPIMQAFAEGKKVEQKIEGLTNWHEVDDDLEISSITKHRIKPEPKYRPFRTHEECWEEMHNHPDFGWIKDDDVYRPIIKIDKEKIYYLEYGFKRTGITYSSFKESLELKFADGTPFGIKEN